MSLSVDLYNVIILLNENVDKINIPNESKNIHAINKNNVNTMIENMQRHSCMSEDDKRDTIKFITKIIEIFKYINYDEYLNTIKNIVNEIIVFLKNNSMQYQYIYFGGLGNVTKSYTWVLFLFLNEMIDFFMSNMDILYKIKIIDDNITKLIQQRDNTEHKILYLLFDDMSYSGKQIEKSIPTQSISNNVDIYITLPYISTIASQLIMKRNTNVCFWKNTIILESVSELFMQDQDAEIIRIYKSFCKTSTRSKYYKAYQCYEDSIPVYFDHKIADGVSTLQKLLYYGIYPIEIPDEDEFNYDFQNINLQQPTVNVNENKCIATCVLTPLIDICAKNNITQANNTNYCNIMITDIDDDITCPITYYKTIQYTVKNENIDKYAEMTLIDIINYYSNINIFKIATASCKQYNEMLEQLTTYKQKYDKYKQKYLQTNNKN